MQANDLQCQGIFTKEVAPEQYFSSRRSSSKLVHDIYKESDTIDASRSSSFRSVGSQVIWIVIIPLKAHMMTLFACFRALDHQKTS